MPVSIRNVPQNHRTDRDNEMSNFSSIITNMSAMSAVQNLNATEAALAKTQNQISTGLSVSSAEDNAAYFSIAQTMRTNVSNLSAVSSSLNLGSSVVSTATAATNQITSVLQSISADLVTAKSNVGSASNQGNLQTAITALNQQLASIVSSASFNGTNLLDGSSGTSVSIVSGVTGSGANTTVNSLTIDTTNTNLNGATFSYGTDSSTAAVLQDAAAVVTATTNNTAAQEVSTNAQTANTAAVNALTSILGQLTQSDLGGVTTAGTGSAAFTAAFGADATMTAAGVVSDFDANSLAGQLLGNGNIGATNSGSVAITITGTTPALTAALGNYKSDTLGGGTLGAVYGKSSTQATTTTTTGVGGAVEAATTAASNLTTAQTTYNTAFAALSLAKQANVSQIAGGALFSVGQISLNGATTAAQIDAYIKQVGTAIAAVGTASEQLGAAGSQIDLQSTYSSSLSGSLTSGVGSLVDADMNEASTRLNALQTQQQLGVQALSVANQNSQLILKLFGNG